MLFVVCLFVDCCSSLCVVCLLCVFADVCYLLVVMCCVLLLLVAG